MTAYLSDFKEWKAKVPPLKSRKYLQWLKQQFPRYELHHILGSFMGKKSTDYLVVPVTPEKHRSIQVGYKRHFKALLPTAILLLSEYAKQYGITIDKIEVNEIVGKIKLLNTEERNEPKS